MEKQNTLDHVKKGMSVVREADKEKLGTVDKVQYGAEGAHVELPDVDTIMDILAEALNPPKDYPEEFYKRLYREGFIVVERTLGSDIAIMPDQIVHVVDGEVHIDVDDDDTIEV